MPKILIKTTQDGVVGHITESFFIRLTGLEEDAPLKAFFYSGSDYAGFSLNSDDTILFEV